jgi:simple sugar transport system permease protein
MIQSVSLRSVASVATPVLGVLLFSAMLLVASGYDVVDAASAAWRGAFGSPFAILSATLKRATPLLMMGVALAIAFRAGVLNIGADGQFLAGAVACIVVGTELPPSFGAWAIILAELTAAMLAGALWAGIAAWLKARRNVNEVVSTLLLNFVALHLVGYLIRGPLQEPTGAYPQSITLPDEARLPLLITGHRLHVGFALGVVVAMIAKWYLRNTAGGFQLRAVGASATAAAAAGRIAVRRVRAAVLVASGALAGLAGAGEVAGVTHVVYEGLSPGYGYTAIAVALLAGLRPLAVVAAATLFGALGAGADAMQRDAGVPAEMALVVAAAVVLAVLGGPAITHQIRRRASVGVGVT